MADRPQFAPRRHRAQERLLAWQRAAPHRAHYWRAVDEARAGHRQWPRYVYLPATAAGRLVADAHLHAGVVPTVVSILEETMALSTYAAWRLGQGIYRYDPTLYEAILSTPLTGDLPIDVFRRLPEWAVYIETPGITAPTHEGPVIDVHGVYAWIDYEARSEHDLLQIGFDTDQATLPVATVPLVGSLDAAIAAIEAEWGDAHDRHGAIGLSGPTPEYAEATRQGLPPILALVLYLCADEAEIGDGTLRPTRPRPQKTKQGWRLFPAATPTTWDVGLRIGAALRTAVAREHDEGWPVGARRGPRAHIRRAHWHTYWTGPRRGERADEQQRLVRWIPPLPINVDPTGELPAVIHQVE